MGSTAASRLLGFVRIAVVSAVFGGSGEADVLNLVFNIPNNLRKLMAEGALSSAFIPVLSGAIVTDASGDSSRRIVRAILGFQFVVLVPFLLVSVFFAQPIVDIVLNFPDPDKQAMAGELYRWLIHYLLLISVSAVLMGTANSHGKFLIPAVTPILFSVAVVASITILYRRLGIYSMAVGVLVGGMAQVLFQLPEFRALGYGFRLSLRFNNPEFRTVMRRWLPVVATSLVYIVNQQVALNFASGLEDGSGSAVTNALTFWQLPFGIFSASITTVLFPRMSRQFAVNDLDGARESVRYGFRYLIALLVPSGALMALLSHEIVAVALQRGEFTVANTAMTGPVLIAYSAGLLSAGAFAFFQRFFYSQGNFRVPLIAACLAFVVDISFALWLKETRLRVVGIAAANSISFTVGLVYLYSTASRSIGKIGLVEILPTIGKVTLSLAPTVTWILAFRSLTGEWWREGSSLGNFARLCFVGLGAIGILASMYYLLKMDIVDVIRRKKSGKDTGKDK